MTVMYEGFAAAPWPAPLLNTNFFVNRPFSQDILAACTSSIFSCVARHELDPDFFFPPLSFGTVLQ